MKECFALIPRCQRGHPQRLLTTVTVLGIDEEVCIIFGREMAGLRQVGRTVGDMDLLIAATALRHDLTLPTADHDFERIENLTTIFS